MEITILHFTENSLREVERRAGSDLRFNVNNVPKPQKQNELENMKTSRFLWILVILTVIGIVQALEHFTTFTAFGATTFAGEQTYLSIIAIDTLYLCRSSPRSAKKFLTESRGVAEA